MFGGEDDLLVENHHSIAPQPDTSTLCGQLSTLAFLRAPPAAAVITTNAVSSTADQWEKNDDSGQV